MGQLNSNTPFTRSANFREGLAAAVLVSLWLAVAPARGEERQAVRAQVAEMVAHLPLQARLPAANRLELAIGLPLRNQGALSNLLRQLYTPRNTNFHRFLTPEQFAERFGPTEQDYQSVISYAKSNRFEVLNTFGNRALVVVSGSVADIERTFQVRLGTYRHPTENREFYAPDAAPSVAAGLSVLYLSGFVGTSLSCPSGRGSAHWSINRRRRKANRPSVCSTPPFMRLARGQPMRPALTISPMVITPGTTPPPAPVLSASTQLRLVTTSALAGVRRTAPA